MTEEQETPNIIHETGINIDHDLNTVHISTNWESMKTKFRKIKGFTEIPTTQHYTNFKGSADLIGIHAKRKPTNPKGNISSLHLNKGSEQPSDDSNALGS